MRDGDLDTFFTHESQSTPPSLSQRGKIRLSTKADLLHCLELEEIQETNTPVVNAKFFRGAAVVHMLRPGTAKTFQDYADAVVTPYIYIYSIESVQQVDIVWDVYVADSLKGRREARVSEEEWFQSQHSHRTGWISYMWTKTNQSCSSFCRSMSQASQLKKEKYLCNSWKWCLEVHCRC